MKSGTIAGMFFRLFTKIKYPKYFLIYRSFKNFTMIPATIYIQNLRLVNKFKSVDGCVVECGTWRGGMVGGIAKLLGDREYFLFDSFEGLPEAKSIDGESALAWQNDKTHSQYLDNCKAEISFAKEAMALSGAKRYHITKGWFSDTLPLFDRSKKISILRLDGDWYESTMDCLNNLYDNVVPGGVIIMDDYYVWDGCSRAVHDFLSKRGGSDRIYQWDNTVCYFVKQGT
jgi:O-methyltransferase